MSIFWIIVCIPTAVLAVRWIMTPNAAAPRNPAPSCCDMVAIEDIEPPHADCTAVELKKQYLTAEQEIVDAHDRIMEDSIRRSMAGSLQQGWPVDVAVSQACYTFMSGVCRCPTCQSLINA